MVVAKQGLHARLSSMQAPLFKRVLHLTYKSPEPPTFMACRYEDNSEAEQANQSLIETVTMMDVMTSSKAPL